MPGRFRIAVIAAGAAALIAGLPCTATAQSGRMPILCSDPDTPTNKVGFDLDYDNKTIVGRSRFGGKLLNVNWGEDQIEWSYECIDRAGYACELNAFNRRTGV